MSNIEKRYSFSPSKAEEFRAKPISKDTNSRDIRGYGAVFNQNSKIITEYVKDKGEHRTFRENLSPKAFDRILSNTSVNDVILSVNHDFNQVLARTSSGTLKLSKDDKGLVYETTLPETSRGTDALIMIKRGDYFESSFQFTIPKGGDEWVKDNETKMWTRTINEVDNLVDVTIATYRGAYDNTNIDVADKAIEYNEYKPEDIAVASARLNELENISEIRMKPMMDDTEKTFIPKCIKSVMDAGSAKDNKQAYSMCKIMWDKSQSEKKTIEVDLLELEVEENYLAELERDSDKLKMLDINI